MHPLYGRTRVQSTAQVDAHRQQKAISVAQAFTEKATRLIDLGAGITTPLAGVREDNGDSLTRLQEYTWRGVRFVCLCE